MSTPAELPAGIAAFRDMFANLSADSVRRYAAAAYARGAFFDDTLHRLSGADAIEAYLLKTAGAVESCHARIDDVAVADDGYYLRWTMTVRARRLARGTPLESTGMSHMRVDEDGKIVYHQDYWDAASHFFAHIPLVGRVIRVIKGRL